MESVMSPSMFSKVAEIELVYKSKQKASERLKIKNSADAYAVLRVNWNENKIEFVEQFKVLLLNHANQVIGIYVVSSGGISRTVADPKLIFAAALKANASTIILAHNHPSSNTTPSEADRKLTQKIKEGGLYLDIAVVDHIIVTSEKYYSFADEGIM